MYQYSNSLIRQFPSSVTGNAAVGIQATVYVGDTSALASLFEVDGTTSKSNPVTTNDKGFYSFSVADGDYRIVFSSSQFATLRISVLDGAQIREEFDDLVASNLAFRNEQQAAYDSFVLSQGWDQVGTFAAGFTFTSPNQVGQDADGNWWRWNGSLPKVVAAGTLPSYDVNYKLVGDGVLRSDLANGSADVAGETSAYVAEHLQFAARIKPVVGETNAMPRIRAALLVNDAIYIDGTLPITELHGANLVNKKILGTRGHSLIDAAGVTAAGVIFELSTTSVIDGVSFLGDLVVAPNVNDSTTYANNVDEAVAMDGAGDLSAVRLFSTTSQVNNCEFTRFSYFAVQTGQNLNDAVDSNVNNCRMYQNFGGIFQAERSEYMKFAGNSICYNIYGVYKRGGNNCYTGNNIDHNRVNFLTTQALNDSHGSVVGGTLNHGRLASLIANNIVNGEAFTGVNMFDCGTLGIYLRKSIGVNIQGCLLGQTNIYCEGRSTAQVGFPGTNQIVDNTFNLHGGTYKIYRNWNPVAGVSDPTMPDNCIFRGNFHSEGSRARDGSTWDEQILNDDKAPDADGWMQQGTGDARWTSGKPLDGTKHLGNGATTGAIKVVLPSSVLDATVLTFDVSISTSDGKGGQYVFDVLAQADGSWLFYAPKSITGTFYKIRFGAEAGKWVMYFGELNTSLTGALFSINSVTVQRGNLQYSAIWKLGWLISRETSAFSSVTLSSPDANIVNKLVVYSGDLNTISVNSKVYAYSPAANMPAGGGGVCETDIAAINSDIRWQRFHQEGTNKLFTRSTVTGSAGYTAWAEK